MSREPDMMTVGEVARALRISIRTAYRKVESGEIAGGKIGKLWRIHRSSVEEIQQRCGLQVEQED